MTRIVYSYNQETGVYEGECLANPSPKEPGKFLMPAHSTAEKPPQCSENEIAVFQNGKWSINILTQQDIDNVIKEQYIKQETMLMLREQSISRLKQKNILDENGNIIHKEP